MRTRSQQHIARKIITSLRTALRWLLRGAAVVLALLLLAGGYLWHTTDLPTPERLHQRATQGSTRILDRHGRLLYEVPGQHSGRQRPLPLDEMPPALLQATIAIEDRSFYENPGIDLRGILRAAWHNARSGQIVAGGSTLTQQLARNFLLDPHLAQQRTLERKLREMVLALRLTATYPKDNILAMYLNQTYYGGLSYGVEAAAQHFFGKPVRDLSLAECALLAGLPQAPSAYNPHSNLEAARARQAQVLDAMVHEGFITPERADAARHEPLHLASGSAPMQAPHFVYYALDTLAAQVGTDSVLRGGLTITTTLDSEVQQAAQRTLRRHIDQLATGDVDHNVHNGAVVVLDPASGAVLAMVGSPDYGNAAIQGQYNAALALRQPGSSIKPLTYAAALERGWTPASTLLDVPTRFETREGTPYEPRNYDQRYHGPLLLREALATSSNVAAVRVLDEIGLPALLDIAARLGITSLEGQRERFGLALTLGGGEVRLLELSAAYAAFANGGQRVTPHALLAIERQGSGFATATGQPAPQEAISPQVAYLISDILSDRYARMRAFGVASVLDIDRPAAVKTGTTTDWRDNWTIGYTPDRVVGVWVGNADGSPMRNVSGISGAGPVWHDVMLAAHAGLPPRPFARPDGMSEQEICADSGLLPTPNCPATRIEHFIAGTEPTRPDDTHRAVLVDPARNCRARSDDASAPDRSFTRRVYRVLPPEAEAWAVDAGIPQMPPPCAPAASTVTLAQDGPTTEARPALLEPAPGSSFVLTPGVPPEAQRIELHAQAGGAVARLSIEIDGTTVASFEAPPYRAYWQPMPGTHHAVVVVQDQQGQQQRSAPVTFEVLEDTEMPEDTID